MKFSDMVTSCKSLFCFVLGALPMLVVYTAFSSLVFYVVIKIQAVIKILRCLKLPERPS